METDMEVVDMTVENGHCKIIDTGKSYKLKPLPLDTPLKIIIELINEMDLHLHPGNKSGTIKFISDHPELVEEIKK